MSLNLIQTLAFAGIVLYLGSALRWLVPVLGRWNLPAPVLGGLLIAGLIALGPALGVSAPVFDTGLQKPLMVAFFTAIGFGASLRTLKVGGPLVARFLAIAFAFAIVQNVIGIVVSLLFGLHPLFGVLCGAVTLTGGPATGLAFAPQFEAAGVQGAAIIAVAAAMAGIVSGGVLGGPLGTWLMNRHQLDPKLAARASALDEGTPLPVDDDFGPALLKHVVAILACLWLGGYVSEAFAKIGWTLPEYIGAMLVAAVLRNLDDRTRVLRLSHRLIEELGEVALSLFLAMAIMTLPLAKLAGLVGPLVAILVAQVLAVLWFSGTWVFRWMGKDYDSAVMSSGFLGFMLGTTANAMANMRSLTERYGRSPRAFLIVPLVGAFFIDFLNAALTTFALNVLK